MLARSSMIRMLVSMPSGARAMSTSSFHVLEEGTQSLDALTSANPRVLAYFTAAWCGPCKAIAPKFSELAKTYTGVKFVKIDIDDNEASATKAGISSVPTFISFVDGKPTGQFTGANPTSLSAAAEKLALK